jgi:hypothetical protein
MRVPTGFLLHQPQEQILRYAMLARRRLGHLKVSALVIALVARQRSNDTQFYEVSRNGAAPGRALTVNSQSACLRGAVGGVRVLGC